MKPVFIQKSRGKGKKDKNWSVRYQFEWMPKAKELNLKIPDKQKAKEKFAKFAKEEEKDYYSGSVSKYIKEASKVPIVDHLEDF